MAITNVLIESNTQFPCVGGGFIYDIIAECDLAVDAVDSLSPILAAVGLSASSNVIGLSDVGVERFNNGGNSLIPITDAAGNIEYRLHTTGAAGTTALSGALTGVRLRLIVAG